LFVVTKNDRPFEKKASGLFDPVFKPGADSIRASIRPGVLARRKPER
jgi:hypothetical protein